MRAPSLTQFYLSILTLALLGVGFAASAGATSYWVSPTGSNSFSGLSPDSAWLSVDNGDQTAVLLPGDTVNIEVGIYPLTAPATFDLSGAPGSPIVYRAVSLGASVLDGGGGNFALFDLKGSHNHFIGLRLTNASNNGFEISGSNNLIRQCILAGVSQYAFYLIAGADSNAIYNNTIFGPFNIGVYPVSSVRTTRIINNIFYNGTNGIWGHASNLAAHNDQWNVSSPYVGGIVDSAGGLSVDPLFADTLFNLQESSLCIDGGMDLEYPFSQLAPDIGAVEFVPAGGQTYWVAPDGDNANDGLSQASPWRTLDNGELTAVIAPGDTVNILPGSYAPADPYLLTTSGTAALPIVYRKSGKSQAIINGTNASGEVIDVDASHIVISGLWIIDAKDDAIVMRGDSCRVERCYLKNPGRHGIRIYGNYTTVYRNVVYLAQNHAIKNEDAAEFGNVFYHNTIMGGTDDGLALGTKLKTGRVFNNQIIQNKKGIKGEVENIVAFNNVWGNTGGNLDGVVDSAGGISNNPRLVNPAADRFDLEKISPAINAGLDIGYPFSGPAPDMGAFEIFNVYYVDPIGNDADDGLTPGTAWATIDNGDSSLFPGDTVYILPGDYAGPVIITDSGLTDQHIVYSGNRDSVWIDGSGLSQGVRILGSFVTLSGIQISGTDYANFGISGGNNIVDYCRSDSSNQYGLVVSPGTQNTIQRSTFAGNTAASALVTGESTSMHNCTFYDSGPYGIDCLTAVDFVLKNNIHLSQTGTNTAIRASWNSTISYSAAHNYAVTVSGGPSLGTGSFTADPLMIDPAGGDFHLTALSPAINAGTDVGLPYSGSQPDMGAYESGTLASLEIIPAIDSMRADSQYQFTVIGRDSDGYPADYGTLSWSHTFATGSISVGGLFTPQNTGTGQIQVTSNVGGVSALSPVMTVVAGSLATLTIAPDRDTIATDTTCLFTVTGTDSRGNPVSNLGTISWSVLNGIGTIDAAGLFTPSTAGNGFVRATSSLSVSTITDTITVVPGDLAHLQILPRSHIVSVFQSFQFNVYGLDADSNAIKNLNDSVAWSTSSILGNINGSGLFTAGGVPGTFEIRAAYSGFADTAHVTVVSGGGLDYVRIERLDGTPFGDSTLKTDNDTTRLWCRGYTATSVLIGDVAVTWSVIGNDSIGSVGSLVSTSTNLTLTTPGTGNIVASYSGSIADTSGLITCVAGVPYRIVASPQSATITADSSLLFTGESVDADGNSSLPGISIDWAVLGGIGTISAGGLFSPTTADTGFVIAFGGALADTLGPIIVTPGALAAIVVEPDSVTLAFDTTEQFEVVGYDSFGNARDPGTITWGVVDAIGSIDGSGLFTPSALGITRVTALSDLGPTDTTSLLEIVAGGLASIVIAPDSIDVTTDDEISFTATGYDIGGYLTGTGILTWNVLNGLGSINSSGLFSPTAIGTERVRVTSSIGGIADTNRAVVISEGALDRMVISPDSGTIGLGDSILFTVAGFDQSFNPTSTGTITWSVNGGIGTIDTSGAFVATVPGVGSVTATSNLGISATTGDITVEALIVSSIPIGTISANPGGSLIPVLGLRLYNSSSGTKFLTGLTLREVSRGVGTPIELSSNIASVSLYLDSDNDSLLSVSDSVLATATTPAQLETLYFDSLAITAGAGRTLLTGITVSSEAHDSDSLDYLVLPGEDVYAADSSQVSGPDTLNSLGYVVINGMVKEQLLLSMTADSVISPSDQVLHLATFDLPRNGYRPDTLDVFSIQNLGTATETDFDSLILYRDDGNNSWGGPAEETRLGKMAFTGIQWTRSGINSAISTSQGRFFIGAKLADYPIDLATIVLSVPGYGVEMRSANDGPLDGDLVSTDTITIRTNEQIEITSIPVAGHSIFPGSNSGALLALGITNTYQTARTLDSVRLQVPMTDPRGASQILLDSQIDSVLVYIETDNNLTTFATTDTVIGSAMVSGGQVLVDLGGYPLAGAGGTIQISAAVQLKLMTPRNANTIGLRLAGPTDLYFSPVSSIVGTADLGVSPTFTIDAFPASAVTVQDVGVPTIFGGETNRPVLSLKIPGNGYALDTLRSIDIENIGTLDDALALTRIALWLDRTGNGYSLDDSLLGTFRAKALGTGYEVTNLRNAVTAAGIHLLVTIDVALDRFDGGTAQFRVPTGGLRYRSGTIAANMYGPDDLAVSSPSSQLVVPSNRITAISIPAAGTSVRPGAEEVPLLTFALYNGYLDQAKTLSAVALSNLTRSISDDLFADDEVGQISLYYDADANRTYADDSLIGSGFFSDGRLPLTGFAVSLPPESLSFFFVVADIPVDVIDSDSLAVSIAARSDFQFKEISNLNGDLPLTSGGWQVIDGSVKRQYEVLPLSPQTLSPGDTLIPLIAFRPARNGDQPDQLTGLTIANTLTADGSDIVNVQLWQDANGDDQWQATDSNLGILGYSGGQWSLSGLSATVSDSPAALFVTGDVSPGATPNAAFEALIPLNGCQYQSGNDGPIDTALTADGSFVISSSGLRVTYTSLPPTFSVGQTIAVRFSATNLLGSPINGVTGEIVSISDSSVVAPDSASAGPINLASGGSGEFIHYYTAAQAGTASWRVRAVAAAPIDSSAIVQTASITVQNVPSSVSAQLINTAPTAVTRGQTNVFPMSLRLAHGDSLATSASVRVDSLRIRVEDDAGNAQSAADVFDRLVLSAGYLNLTILETIPDQSSIWLVFGEPVVLPADYVQQFTVLVDISPTAAASAFVISIVDDAAIEAVDRNSMQPVLVTPATSFPMKTASCRIDDPSQQLALSNISAPVGAINVGQQDVAMLTLGLRHPGAPGTSQIQLSSLSLSLVDTNGDTLDPSLLLDRISVVNQISQIGFAAGEQLDSSTVVIPLTTPVTLSAGEIQSINVLVSPAAQSAFTSLALVIPDSTMFTVRDLSSGSPLDVVTDRNVLATGSVFPIASSVATLRQPAQAPDICLTSSLPSSLVGGVDSLSLVTIEFDYPVAAGYSSVTVKNVLMAITDTLQRPLDPDRLFDRMGYRVGSGVVYQGFVDLVAGAARFSFGPAGLLIQPGETVTLELIADIEVDAPYDHFVALISGDASLSIIDATDTTHQLGTATAPGCLETLPFAAGPATIYLPAGRPQLSMPTLPVQLAYPGQQGLTLTRLITSYESPSLQGDISVTKLVGNFRHKSESGHSPEPVANVFSRLQLVIDGDVVAIDSVLADDSVSLAIDSGYALSRGSTVELSIVGDLNPNAPVGNYVLMFQDSLFFAAVDKNLLATVYPILSGSSYPLFSTEISLSEPNLVNSFSNYPNPFIASRGEHTTIAYVLTGDAYVDIQVFTVTGDLVAELSKNAFETEGAHQELTWDGRNGAGLDLAPGTYFCRITARYVNGGTESARRKISVVR